MLGLDSEGHDAVEGHLLEWQQHAADHLAQDGSAGDREAYGGVLRVLVSRTGIVVNDLLDSLRWRVRSDRAAADRADLSADERQALHTVPVLPFESEFVVLLEKHDHGENRRSALNDACRAVVGALGSAAERSSSAARAGWVRRSRRTYVDGSRRSSSARTRAGSGRTRPMMRCADGANRSTTRSRPDPRARQFGRGWIEPPTRRLSLPPAPAGVAEPVSSSDSVVSTATAVSTR